MIVIYSLYNLIVCQNINIAHPYYNETYFYPNVWALYKCAFWIAHFALASEHHEWLSQQLKLTIVYLGESELPWHSLKPNSSLQLCNSLRKQLKMFSETQNENSQSYRIWLWKLSWLDYRKLIKYCHWDRRHLLGGYFLLPSALGNKNNITI